LRPRLQSGELVEIVQGDFVIAAVMAPDQPKAATIVGYHVQVVGSEQIIRNVPPLQLRRRFPQDSSVEVYRGPTCGWCEARVHHEVESAIDDEPVESPLPTVTDASAASPLNESPGISIADCAVLQEEMLQHGHRWTAVAGQHGHCWTACHAASSVVQQTPSSPPLGQQSALQDGSHQLLHHGDPVVADGSRWSLVPLRAADGSKEWVSSFLLRTKVLEAQV